tara:strand:+ start:43631 stop:43978 length:348 start_codon:yes stop_codon:yes gene_type:complete
MYSRDEKEKIKGIFKNKEFIIDNHDSLFHFEIKNNHLKALFSSSGGFLFLNINIEDIEYIKPLSNEYIFIKKKNNEEISIRFTSIEIKAALYHLSLAIMDHNIENKDQKHCIQSL